MIKQRALLLGVFFLEFFKLSRRFFREAKFMQGSVIFLLHSKFLDNVFLLVHEVNIVGPVRSVFAHVLLKKHQPTRWLLLYLLV